ncbi:hypothetical protein Nmel_018398 [Mimus melanotis]
MANMVVPEAEVAAATAVFAVAYLQSALSPPAASRQAQDPGCSLWGCRAAAPWMKSSQDRHPQPPGGPQGSLLESLFPLSCSFCSAGMLTADLCSVLALGVPSCTLHLGGREGRRVLGQMLTLQPAMGAEQGFYMSLLGLSQI